MQARIEKSAQLINAIDAELGESQFAHSDKASTAAILCSLGRQHHRGIVTLIDNALPASAAALLRVLFESYVRSVWLFGCADADQIEQALADNWPAFGAMVTAIETSPSMSTGVLASTKSSRWRTFNGFTHNGCAAFARQLKDGVIEERFAVEDLLDMLNFADSVAVMLALQICVIAQNTHAPPRILDMAQRHFSIA